MDIPRPDIARKKKRWRLFLAAVCIAVLACGSLALSQLKPAMPRINRSSVWIDTVKRGAFLYEVRGSGVLVPQEIRWVSAGSAGRVDRILLLPGVSVTADTVLVELSNPELEQDALEAESALSGAEAEMEKLKVQLESEQLAQAATVASLKCDLAQAILEAEADDTLLKDGLVPPLTAKRSRSKADELRERYSLEQKRLEISSKSNDAQLQVQKSLVTKFQKQFELKKRQVEALHIRAGIDGVLQRLGDELPLQPGQHVALGANIARIANPSKLKAQVKVPEIEAKDIQEGQTAVVDTRNGTVPGRVVRIDPGVQDGTVTVDIVFDGALPRGARPDLSVEGTITIERLDDTLFVGRPVNSRTGGKLDVFKVVDGGGEAVRVAVRFGRSSLSNVEIKEGLNVGDRIILSDMSQWDNHGRIRLN